jgi:proteasome assembly chaperone (PAC2) family protein
MSDPDELRDPWLVAAWPGMGSVALGAGSYLVNKLGAQLVHELPARDLFDIQQIDVKDGLASIGRLPRSMFFQWRHPTGGRDLLIFIGEAQLSPGGYALCHKLLDYAEQRGVKRIVTFAAMATQLHPTGDPRVFGAATETSFVEEMKRHRVEILEEGQISGLNGVLLAAGAERGLPGLCLLGELPFFAVGVPNPRASQAALEVFAEMAGIELDLAEIAAQAKTVEAALLQLLEKMKEAAAEQAEAGEEGFSAPEFTGPNDEAPEETRSGDEKKTPPRLDLATRNRIETLFQDAQQDRGQALRLKAELDRLGVFELYEDRFLDLFKKAE